MIRRLTIATLTLACLCTPPLPAQSTAEKQTPPPVTASLIPVGANSDSYWMGDGPGMRAIPLDPGAAPPGTLCIRHRKEFLTIPAILNRPSIALPVRAGALQVYANQETGEGEDPPLFGNFKVPTTPGHYDIFLNRSKSQKGWDKPDHLVLGSSSTSFPPETFRIINLCEQPIRTIIGRTTYDISPRKVRIAPGPTGKSGKLIPVQAAHATGIILRTGIRLMPRQRANLIFYPGRNTKKPCQATWFYQSEPGPVAGAPTPKKP